MYTLKLESVDKNFLRAAQAVVQENRLWSYDTDVDMYHTTVTLNTMSLRELKRLVDILEAEEFMRNEQA